ncbi:MAG: large conductance mechanosensitive channel protein MscL, partial [Chitinophagaceae bacterium]
DLAIGVIIGGAFNNIVTAMVKSVIMPLIGMIIGDVDKFSELTIAGIKVGALIQATIDFIIIALVLFLVVKAMNRMKAKTTQEAPPPTKTESLLEEIRDSLKK